ncbi:MAG: hypothetical protein GY778_23010 [bacterium]|nr:hypothetical protein [bacterium]
MQPAQFAAAVFSICVMGLAFSWALQTGCTPTNGNGPDGTDACRSDADCDDGDSCTLEFCEPEGCDRMLIPNCPVGGYPEPITSEEDCDAANGVWQVWGLGGTESCNPRTSDAGTPCRDRADCEGVCITEEECTAEVGCPDLEGECSEFVVVFGCWTFLSQEYGHQGVCID